MEKIQLKSKPRKLIGRKVKTLRAGGLLPANIYGKKIKSTAVSVDTKEFIEAFKKAGETGLINLEVEGEKANRAVLVANLQIDPVSDKPIHVDFHQVDLKEKVTAAVSIEVVGESPAEKTGVGTVVTYLDEVEVEALPADLPEKFIVDISGLTEVDQAIYIKDLQADRAKIELRADPETIIAKVEPPQKEEVVAPPAEAVPTEGEAAPEGGVPAEGGAEAEVPQEEKPQAEGKPTES